jgi:hypothetical protein
VVGQAGGKGEAPAQMTEPDTRPGVDPEKDP